MASGLFQKKKKNLEDRKLPRQTEKSITKKIEGYDGYTKGVTFGISGGVYLMVVCLEIQSW